MLRRISSLGNARGVLSKEGRNEKGKSRSVLCFRIQGQREKWVVHSVNQGGEIR